MTAGHYGAAAAAARLERLREIRCEIILDHRPPLRRRHTPGIQDLVHSLAAYVEFVANLFVSGAVNCHSRDLTIASRMRTFSHS